MVRVDGGWQAEIELRDGVWGYKFVVDGAWHVDPLNDDTYYDGYGHVWHWNPSNRASFGNENSLYVKTNHTFTLPGNTEAKKVVLAGSFSGWDEM